MEKNPIYTEIKRLIALLQSSELNKEAQEVEYLTFKVAWTTGSELLEELEKKLKRIRNKIDKSQNEKIIVSINLILRTIQNLN